MASKSSCSTALNYWKSVLRIHIAKHHSRALSTYRTPPPYPPPYGAPLPEHLVAPNKIRIYPPPPSAHKTCPEPLKTFTQSSLKTLDPTSLRRRLFSRHPPSAQVLDILLVRFRTGEPFSGIVMSIRHRGIDTAVLLRNRLTRIGTEMWVKVFSPTVTGIEIVQKAAKRARRARAYYLRKEEKDRGSVQGVVEAYLRRRRELRSGAIGERGGAKGGKKGGKGKKR